MGSPPPEGSKKVVLKLRSVNTIVTAAAKTGRDNRSIQAVTNTAQTNRGNLCHPIWGALIFIIVVIKFIAPNKEETPAKCIVKIAKSTAAPGCPCKLLSGGYKVQPVPDPTSIKEERSIKINEGGSNQKLMLLSLGKAISGAPIIIGTSQLPKPPIIIGITMKKIIIKP